MKRQLSYFKLGSLGIKTETWSCFEDSSMLEDNTSYILGVIPNWDAEEFLETQCVTKEDADAVAEHLQERYGVDAFIILMADTTYDDIKEGIIDSDIPSDDEFVRFVTEKTSDIRNTDDIYVFNYVTNQDGENVVIL